MQSEGYLLGYDIGSSSVKATVMDAASGTVVASATSPDTELEILAPKPGWAEQHPETWWQHIKAATAKIKAKAPVNLHDVRAIGISYQMHGLVMVDKDKKPLRPAIIWCDSRAVDIGNAAFAGIGKQKCLKRLLNSPGNFTASKLKWVKDKEPAIFKKAHKIMLPGDYIAMLLTGKIATTPSGLSEGIFWDYLSHGPAELVLDYYGIPADLLPDTVPTFSIQGNLIRSAADELGMETGIPISYRAGDQPNNAFSLNALNPGEIAATAGTSGVVYGIVDKPACDPQSRVNTFVHVNYTKEKPRYGILLCINGTGILNSWTRHTVDPQNMVSYSEMNEQAQTIPPGSDGLVIIPFGNGAERTLNNRNIGASIHNLQFNLHSREHLFRAVQEGIVYALAHGFSIMRETGVITKTVRAGKANMFLSPIFCEAFATTTNTTVELYNTDGSQGAARGAGLGSGIYKSFQEAFTGLTAVQTIVPNKKLKKAYEEGYQQWVSALNTIIKSKE
jgi:xylulokinase